MMKTGEDMSKQIRRGFNVFAVFLVGVTCACTVLAAAGDTPLTMFKDIPAQTEILAERDAAYQRCDEPTQRIEQRHAPAVLSLNQKKFRRGQHQPLKGESEAQAVARYKREEQEDGAIFKHPAVQALFNDPKFNCTGEGSSGVLAMQALDKVNGEFAVAFRALHDAAAKEADECQKRVNKTNSRLEADACNKRLQAQYGPQAQAIVKQASPKLAGAYAEYYRNRLECTRYREAALDKLPPEVRGGAFEFHSRMQDWEISRNMNRTLGNTCGAGARLIQQSIPEVFTNEGA